MFNKRKETTSDEPFLQKPLRLWPGVVIVILQWLLRFVMPALAPDTLIIGVFGGIIGGLAVSIWWAFFSRAPRIERWGATLLVLVSLGVTSQLIHISLATSNMGLMFPIFSIPVLSLAFVVWAVATSRLSTRVRRVTMACTIVLASGFWALLRTEGMDAEIHQDLVWRWAKSSEDRLLARGSDKLNSIKPDPAAMAPEAEWPGFRGANRDGIINGVKIETDWSESPPVEMWHRSVGPGCSSFAVHDPLLFTQEQRGEYEMVTCYYLETGEPVWEHRDSTRFWDSHAGAGPRSTPTIYKGRVYTSGATGMLDVLDELDGTLIWSRNAAADTKVTIPGWGYSGSPLVIDSVVVTAIAGQLAAYDIVTGKPLWFGPDGGESYSSPHLATIDGVKQIIFLNKEGVAGYAPADGKELWKLPSTGNHILQPALVTDNDILLDAGDVKGMRRITIKNESGRWTTEERWTSDRFKPNFNDYVIHKGYVYGFEGPSLVCMDIENGNRIWRGGRYGGQLILLADQDLLLVLTEEGELALVMATPDKFKEVAHFPAIRGRTWNHPVLAGNILVVRNTEEMAAFRLEHAGNFNAK